MIAFIDTHRDQFGVELICRVLRAAITGFLTSRGYRAAKTRPACDREIRDEQLIADLRTVHEKNYSCYGVLKMQQAMKRQGWRLGREQTRRLMRKAGLRGVQRGKPVFTTITDPTEQRPGRPGQPAVQGGHPEPVMGRRHHLCAHLAGILLHGLRHRRMQQKDCRLGGRGHYAHRGPTSASIQSCCVAGKLRSI